MFVKISTEHKTGGRQPDRLGEIETFQSILTASASASASTPAVVMSTRFSLTLSWLFSTFIFNHFIRFFRVIQGYFSPQCIY